MIKKNDKARVAPFEITTTQGVLLKRFHKEIIKANDLEVQENVFRVIFDREPNPLDLIIMKQFVKSKAEEWGTEGVKPDTEVQTLKVLEGRPFEELNHEAPVTLVPYPEKVKAITEHYDMVTVNLIAVFDWNDRRYAVVHNSPEFGVPEDEVQIMRLLGVTEEDEHRGQLVPIQGEYEYELVETAWEKYHYEG